MKKYALLANPGHNRVYFEAAKKLSSSELLIALKNTSCRCIEVNEEHIEGIFYLTFTTNEELKAEDILIVSKLSFVYAMFEVVVLEDFQLLRPISKALFQYMDTNISSILKYSGKTNEIFTRMMINVAVNSSDFANKPIKMLDPIAGKGTSLYEGLIFGYDVYGIEIGEKVVAESCLYMKKYLETERFKHTTTNDKITGHEKSFTAKRHSMDIAKTKDELKANQTKHWEMVSGNSIYADKYYKKNFFDIIVGDLPYGVLHGNVSNQQQSSMTRNPKELLKSCLGGWYNVLKSGGTIVLAWNNFVLPRADFVELLEQSGFNVFNENEYLCFEHRVDQSIKREIIVAKK